MTKRGAIAQLGLLGGIAIAALLSLHFLFELALARQVSAAAVVLFIVACGLLIPLVRRRAILRNRWVSLLLFLALCVAANVVLVRGDRIRLSREATAFIGATIVTGHRDAPLISNGVVVVGEDGRIESVGEASDIPISESLRVVDLAGAFLVPGLINAHGHLLMDGPEPGEPMVLSRFSLPSWIMDAASRFLRTYPGRRIAQWQMEENVGRALSGGVTTLRGLGDPSFIDVAVRDRIAAGDVLGPRLLVSGPIICVTGGHAQQIGQVIDGPIEGRRAVRNALQHRVDHIKIASTGGVSDSRRVGEAGELQMTPEEIEAIVDEAHRKNVLVAAHAESARGVLEALRAGVDSIEHGAELDSEAIDLFNTNPKALRGYTTLHPTLSVVAGEVSLSAEEANDPQLVVLSKNGNQIKNAMEIGFRQAVEGGVRLGVGTDAGIVGHDAVWKEMVYFTEVGDLSNQEALYLGTLGTAESIGVADITGSIDVGKFADFVVLERDPVDDLMAFDDPVMVVREGHIHDFRPSREHE